MKEKLFYLLNIYYKTGNPKKELIYSILEKLNYIDEDLENILRQNINVNFVH